MPSALFTAPRHQTAKSPEFHGKNGLLTLRLPLLATFTAIKPIRSRLGPATLCNCFCSAALIGDAAKICSGRRETSRGYRQSQFDPSHRRRSAHRIDALPRRLRTTGFGAGPVSSPVRRLPTACSRAAAPANQLIRRSARPVRQSASRPAKRAASATASVYCVRTCDGRYFPLQRHAGTSPAESVQVVLPGRQDHGVLRQQDRHRGGAERHALRRPRQRVRLSRQGERRLLVQRQGRARARPRRCVRRSDAASRRHRCDRRGPCRLQRQEQDRGVHADQHLVERMGPPTRPRSRSSRRRRARRSSRWPTTTPSRSAGAAPRRRASRRFVKHQAEPPPRRRATATRSIPAIRFRTDGSRPGSPCCAGPSIMKSAAGSPGPVSFGRMPA